MPRVLMAEGCREIDAAGRRHYAVGGHAGYRQGGLFDMSDAAARLVVRAGGAIASLNGAAARSAGFRCPQCGFGSWLRACGRCGAQCDREAP